MSSTHKMDRFEVKISDVDIELRTAKGVFRFGVDNAGDPYISTGFKRLVIIPTSSNRANVFEEGKG